MSLFTQLLADPNATRKYLCILEPMNPATGLIETYYYSTHGFKTAGTDTPPDQMWKARLVAPPLFKRSMFSGGLIGGPIDFSAGDLKFRNGDGALDFFRTYAFDTRRVRVLMGGTLSTGIELAYTDYGLIFDGTAAGDMLVGLNSTALRLRGNEFKFDVPALPNVYRGQGHCLALDGVNDQFTLNTHTSQDACAFECEFRCDGNNTAVSTQVLASHAVSPWGPTNFDWDLEISTAGVLSAKCARGGASPLTLSATGDYRDGKFHHVALKLASGTNGAVLYVDGVLAAQGTPPTFVAITAGTLAVGCLSAGALTSNNFNGRVDEVRFWKLALTLAQVQANMNRELVTPVATDMFGYWPLNDNTGTAPADASGNGKTGALGAATAAPTWSSSLSGSADIAGQKIPVVLGYGRQVEPVQIDSTRLIYQVHDGHGTGVPLVQVSAVYDKGSLLTLGVGYTVDLTRGLITLLANPAGTITVDCVGASTFGGALQLDGSTGYVDTAATSNAGSITLEALIYVPTEANAVKYIHGWQSAAAAGMRLLRFTTGSTNLFEFRVTNDATTQFAAAAPTALAKSRWYFVSGVLDTAAGFIYLFINGTQVAATAVTGAWTTTLANHKIGRRPDSSANFFDGIVDECRVWNVARTPAQILDNASRSMTGAEAQITQLWRFEQRSGTSVTNSKAGGATGTTSGTVTWVPSQSSPWDIARWFAVWRGAVTDPAGLNLTSFSIANAIFNYDAGWVIKEDPTIADVLNEILPPVGGRQGFTRASTWQVLYLDAPSGTPAEIYDSGEMWTLEPLAFDIPVWQVKVGYRRTWAVQSSNDLAGIVGSNPTLFQRCTNEWRYAIAEDPAIKTIYPNARTIELLTPFNNQADAQAFADRQLALMKVRRDVYRILLSVRPYGRDANDVVTVTYPRLGFTAGRDVRLLSIDEQSQPGKVSAEVIV